MSKIWALTLNVILEILNDMDRPIVHCCFFNVASSTRRKPKSWKNELEEQYINIISIINIVIIIKFNQVEAKEAKISWKNKARRVSLAARLRPK